MWLGEALMPQGASGLLVVCVLVLLAVLWFLSTRRPAGLPPGPSWGLPILGHLHRLGNDPLERFLQWRRQHGDVFSLYLGSRLVVVFCGYPVLKEAFVKMADYFSDRPHSFIADRIRKNRGVLFSSGSKWKEQRKVTLEILRELGMGRNVLAEKIQEEIRHYISAINELGGQAADLHLMTTHSVSNNICSIVFGRRFDYDDPVFTGYLARVEDNFRLLGSARALNFIPFLEHLPGDVFGIHKILSNADVARSTFFQPSLDQHLASFSSSRDHHDDDDHEASDFIYAYLREMRKKEAEGVPTTLGEAELYGTMVDLFVAGTETSSTALSWALLYFLHHPHVQDACYREVRDVVGTSRPPAMRDRASMVYLEATLQEVLRLADIVPLSGQHSTPCDVTFRGHLIPKGAIILPVMSTVLHDPDIWGGDPFSFRPERFIDAEGKLVRPEELIAFSLGRRACLGEALARMELFLYLSTLVQRFHFLPPEAEELPPLTGIMGATRTPTPYKIRAVRRE